MKFEEPICVVFSATEWVKGKQMEEVMTIKNTLVFFFFKDFICFYCTIYPSFVLFWIEKVMILRVYDCCADGLYLFNPFCYFLIATL
jgi:hypothetical protein